MKQIAKSGEALLGARIRAEKERRGKFGDVRPIIQCDHRGFKFVAVGCELHYSNSWKTVPDFLFYYIETILGIEWMRSELAKPINDRHVVAQWYDATIRLRQKQTKSKDGLYEVVPNGAMRTYLHLAYDLYTSAHHSALQPSMVDRLRDKDQFQGARHELFAAATCLRAGFEIEYENERDVTSRHAEFVATHRSTQQRITVEAKSRHREGVLGKPGEVPSEPIRVGIRRLLHDAVTKPAKYPLVIFVDLNLPPVVDRATNENWFNEVERTVLKFANEQGPTPFNMVVVTTYPDHFRAEEVSNVRAQPSAYFSKYPRIPVDRPEPIMGIYSRHDRRGSSVGESPTR